MKLKSKSRLTFIIAALAALSIVLAGCESSDESSSKKSKKSDSSSSSSSVIDDSSNSDSSSGDVTMSDSDSDTDTTTTTTTTTAATTTTPKDTDSEPDEYPIDYPPDVDPDTGEITTKKDNSAPDETTTTEKNIPDDELGDEIKPIKDYFEGIEEGNVKKIEGAIVPEMIKKMQDEGVWNDAMDSFFERFKEQFGDDYKITYKIKSEEKLGKEKLQEYNDGYKETLSLKSNIDEMYDIKIKATIQGNKDKQSDISHMIVGLVGGKWYLFEM